MLKYLKIIRKGDNLYVFNKKINEIVKNTFLNNDYEVNDEVVF